MVDADACPVKDEVYKVAWRREVPVKVVSNSWLRVPAHPLVERPRREGRHADDPRDPHRPAQGEDPLGLPSDLRLEH